MTPRDHAAAGRLAAVTGRLTGTTGRLAAAHALADRLASQHGAHAPDGTALHKTRPGCAFNC